MNTEKEFTYEFVVDHESANGSITITVQAENIDEGHQKAIEIFGDKWTEISLT